MNKLQALIDYLVAARFCRAEQLHAAMESGEPDASFRAEALDTAGITAGLLLFRHRYTAVIGIERDGGDLAHVLALVHVWMEENGGDHDEFLGWVGEPVADRLSDVDLRVQFEEQITYIPAEPGYTGVDKIAWRGADYKRADIVPDQATAVDGVVGVTA